MAPCAIIVYSIEIIIKTKALVTYTIDYEFFWNEILALLFFFKLHIHT